MYGFSSFTFYWHDARMLAILFSNSDLYAFISIRSNKSKQSRSNRNTIGTWVIFLYTGNCIIYSCSDTEFLGYYGIWLIIAHRFNCMYKMHFLCYSRTFLWLLTVFNHFCNNINPSLNKQWLVSFHILFATLFASVWLISRQRKIEHFFRIDKIESVVIPIHISVMWRWK